MNYIELLYDDHDANFTKKIYGDIKIHDGHNTDEDNDEDYDDFYLVKIPENDVINKIEMFYTKNTDESEILENKRIFTHFILKYDTYNIVLYAYGECCSFSWFEMHEESFEVLICKKISSIQKKEETELDISDCFYCERKNIYEIVYTDQDLNRKTFEFILRNTSNGYYTGWIKIFKNDLVM